MPTNPTDRRRVMKARIAAAVLMVGAWPVGHVAAQCVSAAPNAAPVFGDAWGTGVAISADGTTAIAGAPNVDHSLSSPAAGAVRMLVNNAGTWEQQGFFTGGSFAAGANLGQAVDISADGNTAVAGQPALSWNSSHDGVARVYVRNIVSGTWSQQATLVDPAANVSGQFGASVSISDDGNTIVIGQPGYVTTGNVSGAYVYTRTGTTWSAGVSLPASPVAGEFDEYGSSVAVSPDGLIIAVGAPGRVNGPMSHGAVHVFRKNAGVWTQQAVLTRTVAYLGFFGEVERFGHALSLYSSGGAATLAIGDPQNSELLLPSSSGGCPPAPAGFCMVRYAGCVFLYESVGGGTWTMSVRIRAPEVEFPENLQLFGPDMDDRFGSSVALRGQHLVVGAVGDEDCDGDAEFTNNGSVYRFTGGQMLQKLTHPQNYTNDSFGDSVDVSDDGQTYIAGAPRGDSPGVNFTGTVDLADANLSYPVLGVDPATSAFEITITFPGNDPPPQTFTIHFNGRLFSTISSDCSGEPTAVAVQDYDGLSTVEQSFTIALPGNQSATFGPASLTTVNSGHAAVLDATGTGHLRGYHLGAALPLLGGPESGSSGCSLGCHMGGTICICDLWTALIDWCLAVLKTDPQPLAGSTPTLTVRDLDLTTIMELGLGANNPTIHVTGGINVPPPCPADVAPPPSGDNSVNVTDLLAVIGAWGPCGDPPCAADINGDDLINVTDLLAVIGAWGPCP